MELPGRFLSPVFERKHECGSSFLAVGDSAGCLPISMPFLFPFATSILVLPWQVMGCIPRARKEAVLFPGPPPPPALGGLGKGLGSKSVGGYLLGVLPGKGGVSFFLQAPFPVSWDLPSLNLMLRTQQPSEKVQTRERANCRESVGGAEAAESQQDPVPKLDLSESLNHTRS